ncbi:sensor histidine kinase [Thalassotalea sp. PLHSN55]|uniref:sensor histidine kinase n=1 Tax=Thalassotalea sp. PLHSN55 TaxID=3435888 RepID=UPI003F8241D6
MAFFNNNFISSQQRINRLRMMLATFFICLLIPLSLIIYYVFQQIENDMDFQYQWKSVNALKQINKKLNNRVKIERKRPVEHYSFYQMVSNPLTGELTQELSPLANPENYPENIGLIGYFEINADKTLSTPLLPAQTKTQIKSAHTKLHWQEIERRLAVKETIKQILLKNDFVINDDKRLTKNSPQISQATANLKTELFQVKITDNNELIIFRNYWQSQHHKIQGFIVEQDAYLQKLLSEHLEQGHFDSDVQMRLKVIHLDKSIHQYFHYSISNEQTQVVLSNEPITSLEKKYIFHGYLIAPFQQIQLMFTTNNYHLGSASEFIIFFFIILITVLVTGFLGIYWVGIKQIELTEQRMNFVSSVSHELKTPLTSILMYAEMLKAEMVKEADKQKEYHEFIYNESERLSRLINNILKLSNLNRQQEVIDLEYVNILSLIDTIQSKVSSLIEKNDFKVNFVIGDNVNENAEMLVDLDAFSQIVINLVDNSIKFFNAAKINDQQRRQINITFDLNNQSNKSLIFSVADLGPGISSAKLDRVFELFYREGNELTRTTPGTGIGLALVSELVTAQGGKIEVKPKTPGVEFAITFAARKIKMSEH